VKDDIDLRTLTPPTQYPLYERLAAISSRVAPDTWVVIGGLMTEVLLGERGHAPPRTTTDGDVLGHIAVAHDVIEQIESVLTNELGMKARPTGQDRSIICRYEDADGYFIDLLVPSRTRAADKNRLGAVGTGDQQFLDTISLRTVHYRHDTDPLVASFPSITGAFYAKVCGWKEINLRGDDPATRYKHLIDALALARAASLDELRADQSAGFRKRLRLIHAEAANPEHPIVDERIGTDDLAAIADKLELALDSEAARPGHR